MKIILRSDINGLGKRGDIVEVAKGHGRNYLLPRGLGINASEGAVSQAASMRRRRDLRDAADRLQRHGPNEVRDVGGQSLAPSHQNVPWKPDAQRSLAVSSTGIGPRRSRLQASKSR